jgi:uncharacterized protein with NRDE domain
MCLVAVALDAHPRYALAIAANRDEFHDRAAEPAHWWDEGWLAGRDREAGGTWLGVRRDGRFAFVTNVREGGRRDALAASRGEIVTGALGADSLAAFLARLDGLRGRYNGYNLIAGDARGATWQSNRHDGAQALPRGVSTLSNARLGTPWPKAARLASATEAWAGRGDDDLRPLFDALADRERAPDDSLPSTGVSLDWERLLSPPFIVSETYGTRCSTVLALGRDGEARFVERSFDAGGTMTGTVDVRFPLAPGPWVRPGSAS